MIPLTVYILIIFMMHELLMFPKEVVRPADQNDINQIVGLLSKGQQKGSVLPRSYEEVEKVIDNFIVCSDGVSRELVGCASLEPYELPSKTKGIPGIAELRSVVSLRPGIGERIVKTAVNRARVLGIKDVFATTDNLKFFKKCHLREKRGGQEILWMDLQKDKGTIFNRISDSYSLLPATPDDADDIAALMEKEEEVLPMDKEEIKSRAQSFYVCRDQNGELIASVGAIIYPTLTGLGNPRMGVIRGLAVKKELKGKGLEEKLLDFCYNKFLDKNVKQAFTTGSTVRYNQFKESGYFYNNWGSKMVLWLE